MAGRRILILTPGAIGSNPRVVKEADALHAAGHRVTVISIRTLDEVDRLDDAVMARIGWQLERIDLRSRTSRLRPRLLQTAARMTWDAVGVERLAPFALNASTSVLHRHAARHAADLTIAHYPAALPVAARSAQRARGRFAYDAEDFHLGDWPDDARFEPERRLLQHVEGRYLHACASVTASSPATANAYEQAYGIHRPVVVLNAFDVDEAGIDRTATISTTAPPSVYWFSQTIGPNRGLECAVRAIAMSNCAAHLHLRGTPAPGFAAELMRLARESGAADRVHLLAPAPPDAMVRLAATHHLGLCSETGFTPNNARALSNKLFTYLAAGVPPLLSATPAQRAFALEAGLGDLVYPIGDAPSLSRLLDGLLGDPSRLAEARARTIHRARESYNWKVECRKLLSAIDAAFAPAADVTLAAHGC